MAALWSCGDGDRLLREPFAAFHVSGGTTEVLYVTPRDTGFAVTVLGGSADLHAGQAIDRVGVMMGLRFPCGRELEELAAQNTREVPRPKISVQQGVCHFSGLENLAARLWQQTGDRPLVAAFVLEYCARTLERLTAFVDERYPGIPIVYAGGVMSNRYLQAVLGRRERSRFAAPAFSADNAAGGRERCASWSAERSTTVTRICPLPLRVCGSTFPPRFTPGTSCVLTDGPTSPLC